MGLRQWLRWYDIDRLDQRDPERVGRLCRWLYGPLKHYFRAEVRGIDRLPQGAALIVGNHNALLMTPESFLFCTAVYRQRGLEDVPYGLGHELAIRLPILNQIVVPLGAVRASHRLARELFALGRKVLVFPGSEFEAFRSWRDRDRIRFGGRKGYIRLALAAGVPVVPMVAAGAQETLFVLTDGQWIARRLHLDRLLRVKAWPIALGLPWGLMLAPLPFLPWPSRILIEVLEPIRFEPGGPEAADDEDYVARCAAVVEAAMQEALTRLAADRKRMPT